MDEDAKRLFPPFREHLEDGCRIHDISVAHGPLARLPFLGSSRYVPNRYESQRTIAFRHHDPAAFGWIGGAGVSGDLTQDRFRKLGHGASGRYRSARSGKIVTTTPPSPRR